MFGVLAGCVLHLSLSFTYSFFNLVQDDKKIETLERSLVSQSKTAHMSEPRIKEDDDELEPYMEQVILSAGAKDSGRALAVRRRRQWRVSHSSS